MSEHALTREMIIDRPRPQVFDFFADAGNLERITPSELKFRIFTPLPVDLCEGTLIEYRLSIHGFPINWRTEISLWNPPFEFIDRELKGPYKQWIHRHVFVEIDASKTLIRDEVKYCLPFEPFGELFHWLIRAKLDHIFDFREIAVRKILEDRTF